MRHYNAQQIAEIASARLANLAEYHSTKDLPITCDEPIIHAGSLLMTSNINWNGMRGHIQVPIKAGMFEPHTFEHAIDERFQHILSLLRSEVMA